MKDTDYNQINPLIRVKETELLTNEIYEQMIQATSLEDALDVLSNTIYAPYATQEMVEKFDWVHVQQQQKLFQWVNDLAPDPRILLVYTSRFTFHNLKVLTKEKVLGISLEHLLIPDGTYSFSSLKSAVYTQKSNKLPPEIVDIIVEVNQYLQESTLLQGIDIIYDRSFLRYQRQLANQIGNPDLLREVISFIDLTNITILARGILRKNTPNFLSTVLSSSGSIPKKELLEKSAGSLEQFTSYLLTTHYADFVKTILKEDQSCLDVFLLNRACDDYLTHSYEKAKIAAFGPLPLLAYLNAREVEWKNLRLILVGKQNKFTEQQIRERMRIV